MNRLDTSEPRAEAGLGRLGRMGFWLLIPALTVAPILGSAGTVLRGAVAVCALLVVLRVPSRPRVGVVFFSAGFMAALCVAALAAHSLPYGATRLMNWVMFVPLLFLTPTRAVLGTLLSSLVASGWLQCLGIILQMYGLVGGVWGGLLVYGTEYDPAARNWLMRYTGFMGNPNDLGLFLAIASVCAVTLVARRVPAHRMFLVLSGSIFVVGLFLTGSRAGIMGLVLGVVVTLAYMSRLARRRLLALGILAVSAVFISLGSSAVVLRSLFDIVRGTDMSAVQRMELWATQSAGGELWFSGGGFGGYLGSSLGWLATSDELYVAGTVDNAWLKLFLETGLLGVALFAGLWTMTLLPLVGKRIRTGDAATRAGLVVATMLIILWRSLSADIFDINPWNGFVWMLFGLAAGSSGRTDDPDVREDGTPFDGGNQARRSAAHVR